jgi:hypothetical protein
LSSALGGLARGLPVVAVAGNSEAAMATFFKICIAGLKLAASVGLAADALGSERPLMGVLVGFLSLVPLAWVLQDMMGPELPAA